MCKFKNKRWRKHYNKKRIWPKYNNQLVIKGEFYLNINFLKHWDDELKEMNKGKKSILKFPDSFIKWMAVWH
ncbi:MAG: hypothetical protein QXZ12_08485 [Thermoplasmata archaeon]